MSERTVKSAVRWLWKLEHMTAVSHSSSAEALLEAMADEAVSSCIFSQAQVNPRVFSARLAALICPDQCCKDKYSCQHLERIFFPSSVAPYYA